VLHITVYYSFEHWNILQVCTLQYIVHFYLTVCCSYVYYSIHYHSSLVKELTGTGEESRIATAALPSMAAGDEVPLAALSEGPPPEAVPPKGPVGEEWSSLTSPEEPPEDLFNEGGLSPVPPVGEPVAGVVWFWGRKKWLIKKF
jgi:hypothetical protein